MISAQDAPRGRVLLLASSELWIALGSGSMIVGADAGDAWMSGAECTDAGCCGGDVYPL
jgi:hypothetical protein